MLWRGREGSSNVEDHRGISGGGLLAGGGIGGVIIAILYSLFSGGSNNVPELLPGQKPAAEYRQEAGEDTIAKFVSVVLKETEDIWGALLENYREPKLRLFTQSTQSSCGFASAAVGPFYCPADQRVYIDLSFFRELKNRFNAPGDFAMAYVVAHEVGHHIQNLMGTSDKVHALQQRLSEKEANQLSVKLELQADFLAGVWAHYADNEKNIIEPNDIEEALNAANAIGDDKLQQQSQGYVVPDAFTHGTSQQRMYWFMKGFETGDLRQGNTFEEID